MRSKTFWAALALWCTADISRAIAQCPNGTPPPCARVVLASSARRADPTLDERAWIVVPFTNDAKAQDVEWLRDASVNLLSLDLSRWSDIAVVDDKRVGDLLRELPPARTGAGLTLNDGLTLARRAGAGKLVMGDFVKLGKSLRIVANVFDTKTGGRLRTVQQNTEPDSLLTAFAPLARGVLAVSPPPDARLGALGTSRVDAYQEYLLGVTSLNRFELTNAKQHLLKALALDSTFALAHFKLAVAIHWGDDAGDTTELTHALAAARLGGSLPPRERALISARVALTNGETERACDAVRKLVAKDSSDVEALYEVGECEYHGGQQIGEPIDSIRGSVKGNWNVAIASFQRVLMLDPTYHPAFEHILNALTTDRFTICPALVLGCGNDPSAWVVTVLRVGDSLVIQPVRAASKEMFAQQDRSENGRVPLLNKRAAQRIAEEWVTAGPAEARAHINLANVDLSLGEVDRASDELRSVAAGADEYARVEGLTYRVEIAIIRGRGAEGRALLDTLARVSPNTVWRLGGIASLSAAFGRLAPATAAIRRIAERDRWSPERLRYTLDQPRTMLGVPGDSAAADERRYWNSLTTDTACAAGLPRCRTTALLPSLAYGLRIPRDWWPPFVVAPIGFRFDPAGAIVAHNPDSLAASVHQLEALSRTRIRAGASDQATAVLAADAALAGHDTAASRRITRFFVDSVTPMATWVSPGALIGAAADGLVWRWVLIPRMMLLRADLAAAAGDTEEARVWYEKVISLWSGADPELQPTVTRIRAAMAALGSRR